MFTDSDWDNNAPTPLEGPSRAHRAAGMAVAVVIGLAIGAAGASWWWAARGEMADRGTAPRVVAAAPAALVAPVAPAVTEIIASAPPSSGRIEPASAPPIAPVTTLRTNAAAPTNDPAARRKELAWSQWYEKPRECVEDRRGERLVECANHYIRARREFESTYAKR